MATNSNKKVTDVYASIDWQNGDVITRQKIKNIDNAAHETTAELKAAQSRTSTGDSAPVSGSLGERLNDMIIASANSSDTTDETMLWINTDTQDYTIPVQSDFDHLVMMQDQQPSTTVYPDAANKIWVKSTTEQVEIPTSDELEQLQNTIASEYSTSKTYAVGDYVYYEGQLYKCVDAVAVAGTWNASHWNEAVLTDDLNNLNKIFSFAVEYIYEPKTQNGITFSWDEKHRFIHMSGTRSNTNTIFYNIMKEQAFDKTTYYYYCQIDGINAYFQFYMRDNSNNLVLVANGLKRCGIITIPNEYLGNKGYFRIALPTSTTKIFDDDCFLYFSDQEEDVLRIKNDNYRAGYLPSGNLNDYFTNEMIGTWLINDAYTYSNLPENILNIFDGAGILTIERVGDWFIQTIRSIHPPTNNYCRTKYQNTIYPWRAKYEVNPSLKIPTNIDDIKIDGYYFQSQPAGLITNWPLGENKAGWLEVETNALRNTGATSVVLQKIWPYNELSNTTPLYRVYQLNAWTDWQTFGGNEIINYNNTYNITTTPTITTDVNGWLQPVDTILESNETNKTDMTPAIMSMLNNTGYCHLAPGVYYVSGNIDMPEGSTLIGCGDKTIIKLLNSVTSGYCVKINQRNIVKDISFIGDLSSNYPTLNDEAQRHAIYFFSDQSTSASLPRPDCCVITNCHFRRFMGSGIYGYDTGATLCTSLLVSNCYFNKCFAGINLSYRVEYCKFTNIITFRCYYGCINNGGNNTFINCTFHGTIGFMIDNENNQSGNSGHGTVMGCVFNHIDNQNNPSLLGSGDAIICKNTPNGFVFTGCQIWYGDIRIYNSKGISISNSQIGNSKTAPEIEIMGTYPVFFSNCIFSQIPTITAPSNSHFDNCYLDTDGSSISI